jgi:hypothetical protein
MNQLFSNLFHNLKIEGLIFFTHGQLPKTKLSLAIVTYQSQPVLEVTTAISYYSKGGLSTGGTTLSITIKYVTLSIECCYGECRNKKALRHSG